MRTLLGCLVLLVAAPAAGQRLAPFNEADILKVATLTVLDLTDDGRHVAAAVRRLEDNATTDHRRFGDPTYIAPSMADLLVIDTRSGAIARPAPGLLNIRHAAWNRAGTRLAVLTSAETAEGRPASAVWIYDTAARTLTEVPRQPGAAVAATGQLAWTADDRRLVVALRDPADDEAAQAAFRSLVQGPVVVQGATPFLDWDRLRRLDRRRALAELDPATGRASVIVPPAVVSSYQVARDGSFVTWLEDATTRTNYDVIFGTDNALKVRPVAGEARTVVTADVLKTATPRWSDDGRTLAFAEKGEVFVQRIDETTPRSITPKPPSPSSPPGEAAAPTEAEAFAVTALSPDGSRALLTSKKGWYVASTADGTRTRVVELHESDETVNPRLTFVDWTPAGNAVIVQYGEPDRWERGVARIDARTGQMTTLVKDTALYQGVRVSRDGSTFVFLRSDGDRPADLYVADASMAGARKLTDLNPWIAGKALPVSELVTYRDADGKVLHGVLRYPVGYEKGRRYPTVFEIYETFFDNGFNGRAALLANHGYAVFHPSVNLVVGRPGESWAKGVTAAANRLIDMGVADPDRLGVHGTSYGGYATVLLLTETDRFKAAINISGKVNMVSFYTDSERLGVRNTHAPEKSQDRIGGTLWEYPERYIEHSAIFRLDRVKTPLLTISGDQDPNVPASQSRELYYALRRLGREVEWVRYVNGGHRPPNSVEESIDFERRIVAWYDRYLKHD